MKFTDENVPTRDAATVVLLRDGTDGIEVFMLKRNLDSDFVGGAYVFPGGGVDPEDRLDDLDAVCEGLPDAEASARVGVEKGGLAFWVAAIRESFEEAGVLLAYESDGDVIDLDAAEVAKWGDHRTAVDNGERRLVEVCEAENLRLAVDGMHYFAHWITPEGPTRRYDTYFFMAAAPANQTPLHDDREVIANEWVRPVDGLNRALAGELTMLPPTVSALEAIKNYGTVADAMAAVAQVHDVPSILPKFVRDGDKTHFLLPGQPGYDGGAIPEDLDPASVSVPLTGFDLLPTS